jgi:hypothetical protein
MKKLFLFLVVFSALMLHSNNINMEGYLEAQFKRVYNSENFEWDMEHPNLQVESRFHGSPVANTNYYFKFYAESDYYDNDRPVALFAEGHINFKQEKAGKGFSTTLFTRENGNYWTDGSMLGILNTGSVDNDGNGQGARLDAWHNHNGSMTYVFSDFSSGGGDDVHLFRYRQSFKENKINTGLFFQRKHYSTGADKDFNQVVASDFKMRLGRYYINTEAAISSTPSDSLINALNDEYHQKFGDFFKSNIAAKAEVNGFRLGSPKLGFWFFTPGAYAYGISYRNYMGDNQSNKIGYWINSYYHIPYRAITFTLNFSGNKLIEADEFFVAEEDFYDDIKSYETYSDLYSEVYIEFIHGFKGKVSFNKKDEMWQGTNYKHYDIFTELSVENRLAKLLAQFKVKDIGEIYEKQIAGIELGVNLTEKWRLFARGMIANDRASSRNSIFGEIQYRFSGNAEFYLQYGPSWWGQWGLVNDSGFAANGNMQKEIRLIIKGWF